MSFSKTETKHNMNTPKTNKPKSLLATLALYTAQFYQNRCKSRGHAHKAWGQVSDQSKKVAVESMTATIPEAVTRLLSEEPNGFPTKQALRSYLSVRHENGGKNLMIDGFDDLYDELRIIFDLKHVVSVQQLEDRLAASSKAYHLQDERHAVELAKIRHDFGAATNSHEKQIATMDARITELTRLLGDKTTGINDRNVVICEHEKTIERLHQSVNSLRETNTAVVNRNTALQRKNEELVGLPKPYHWDEIETMGSASNPDIHDSLDYTKIMNAILTRPQPFHDGRPIVIVMNDTTDVDKLKKDLAKATEYNQRANADCKTYAENAAKWQKEAQSLNATISRIGTERDDANKELAKLSKSVETLGNQVRSAKAEEWDRCISVTSQAVSEIIKEFRIDSPTNDILDMVRAACERAVASDGLLDQKNKEISALKSKQFGSPVEKVMEFIRHHGLSIDTGSMGQIVHHILTAEQLAEATRKQRQTSGDMGATALGNSRGVVGHAPVPERQYEGGVPRTVGTYADSILEGQRIRSMSTLTKKKHDKFDIACGLVCLGGGALGILFYAAKYLGLLS